LKLLGLRFLTANCFGWLLMVRVLETQCYGLVAGTTKVKVLESVVEIHKVLLFISYASSAEL